MGTMKSQRLAAGMKTRFAHGHALAMQHVGQISGHGLYGFVQNVIKQQPTTLCFKRNRHGLTD